MNKNIKIKIFYYLIAVLGASALNADTLDVEIHGVTKAGLLHLAIYDSKDVFESDKWLNTVTYKNNPLRLFRYRTSLVIVT